MTKYENKFMVGLPYTFSYQRRIRENVPRRVRVGFVLLVLVKQVSYTYIGLHTNGYIEQNIT